MTRLPVLPLLLAALLSGPSAAAAQDVSVPVLKAAFLTNFAKFAVWPDEGAPAGRTFTFCVSGDKAVAAALEQGFKAHPGQEPVSVIFVEPDGPLSACQMLYLGGLNLRDTRRALDALKGAPTFTVSDVDGFAQQGGMVQLRLEQGRMRFVINPAAAQRAHIALSAKLLSLATIVKDAQ
jgi:uncharacterized protein DUF4154